MKRILTVQDISCIGKCSLTAVIPVISALGTETCVLPTAMLSTHTGFDGFTFRDLTDEFAPITAHWAAQNISFDGIYTGYLGSAAQTELVKEIIKKFIPADRLILIDPVLGDNGRLYSGISSELAGGMRRLCAEADIITPNLTEACYITQTEYKHRHSESYIKNILKKLTDTGVRTAVISSVNYDAALIGAAAYDRETGRFTESLKPRIDGSYQGTGDLFAACLFGMLMRGADMTAALDTACGFISECIKNTVADKNHRGYGVNFEQAIPWLVDRL